MNIWRKDEAIEVKMRKVFALFRNPVSYIDPLLQNFSKKTDLFVAFSVNKPHKVSSLQNFKHIFLRGGEKEKYWESRDYELFQWDVRKWMAKDDYDFVFIATSYWSPTTWIAIHEAKKRRLPMMTRMTVVVDNKNKLIQLIKRVVVTSYCRQMDAGVYECEEQKKYMLKYGMHKDQLFFAPCAVNNEYFAVQKDRYDKEDCRRELGIDEDAVVVIVTGQLIERKRPLDVIKAIRILKSENCKLKLYILGEGVLRGNLESFIAENKLSNEVSLCGNVDHENMSKYLSAGDVYVMASDYDASPKALNEAMNFELPIVISDGVMTAREMCDNGKNGYIYHSGDVDALSSFLREFCIDPGKITAMGKRSREIVSHYSFDAVTDAWIEAIEYSIRKKKEKNG